MLSDAELTATVVEKAKALGASVAGVVDVGNRTNVLLVFERTFT
jgi:hypothetical protein